MHIHKLIRVIYYLIQDVSKNMRLFVLLPVPWSYFVNTIMTIVLQLNNLSIFYTVSCHVSTLKLIEKEIELFHKPKFSNHYIF